MRVGRIRDFYQEVLVGTFFVVAISFFVLSLYSNKNQNTLLSEVESRSLLAEARRKRILEEKIAKPIFEQDDPKSYLRAFLEYIGCRVLRVEIIRQDKLVALISEISLDLQDMITESLENVTFKKIGQHTQLTWIIKKKEENKVEKSDFILAGIVYVNENSWQVWINNKMYDNNSPCIDQENKIQRVTSESVFIESNGKTREICFKES